jgi:SNF2 family DNA or RNA helicase
MEPLWNGFTYREHQVSAIQWMLEQEQDDLCGGFLCDEMGLGKTI